MARRPPVAHAEAVSQENVDLARRSWELASQGADDEVARYLAPDVEWHHNIGLGTPMEGTYHGRDEVLAFVRALRESFGTLRFEVEEVRELSSGEVLSFGQVHAEGRGSGATATTPFGAVTEIRNGLAVRQRFWLDREAALEAVGFRE
jgi:ketosteroid isomerase-like protein